MSEISKLLQDRYRDSCMFLEWTIHEWQEDDNVSKALLCDLLHKEIDFYFGELHPSIEQYNSASSRQLKSAKEFHLDLQRFEEDAEVTKKLVCHCFRVIFQGESAKLDVDTGTPSPALKTGFSTITTTHLSKSANESLRFQENRKSSPTKKGGKVVRKSNAEVQTVKKESSDASQQQCADDIYNRIIPSSMCSICLKPLQGSEAHTPLPCFHRAHAECISSSKSRTDLQMKECCWVSAELLSLGCS